MPVGAGVAGKPDWLPGWMNMEEGKVGKFSTERERLQNQLVDFAGLNMKRLLTIDNKVYQDGALTAKTKELLGLVSSAVLRCDDCINYHLVRCHEEGVSKDELEEALSVAYVVGGSITVPHLRRAVDMWLEYSEE